MNPVPVEAVADLPPTDPTTPVAELSEPVALPPEPTELVLDPGAEKQAVAVRGMERTTLRSRRRKVFIEGLQVKRCPAELGHSSSLLPREAAKIGGAFAYLWLWITAYPSGVIDSTWWPGGGLYHP